MIHYPDPSRSGDIAHILGLPRRIRGPILIGDPTIKLLTRMTPTQANPRAMIFSLFLLTRAHLHERSSRAKPIAASIKPVGASLSPSNGRFGPSPDRDRMTLDPDEGATLGCSSPDSRARFKPPMKTQPDGGRTLWTAWMVINGHGNLFE